MRLEKLASLLEVARRLAGSAEGLTLDEIAGEAGVNRRTAERMRDALQQLFPQLEEVPDGRAKRFRIPGGLDGFMQTPTADELAELDIAIRHLNATGSDARAELLCSLGVKLRTAIRASARRQIEPDLEALLSAEALAMQAGPRPILEPDAIATIRRALKSRQTLRFGYQGARRRHVDPWGLIFGRLPYLVGPAVGHPKPVLWRLDRLEGVAVAEAGQGPPATFNLGAYAAGSFGAFQEEPEDVVLRFSADAAEDARRFLFHPTQVLAEGVDGSLIVSFRSGGMRELVHHLFTWADTVEIVAPGRLRAMMVATLERSLNRHAAGVTS